MNRGIIYLILVFIASSFGMGQSRGAETNTPSRFDYQAFRVIEERNIFNPNRFKGSSSNGESGRSRRDRQYNRTDSFTLRGTMSYEKGRFAFFEGSNSDYRKALEIDGQIAGYKVAEIGADYVRLENNGKEVALRVGGRMRKSDNGWAPADGSEAMESSADSDSSAKTEATDSSERSDSTASAVSDGGNDVLKRLLQKREKEVGGESAKEKTQPESTPK